MGFSFLNHPAIGVPPFVETPNWWSTPCGPTPATPSWGGRHQIHTLRDKGGLKSTQNMSFSPETIPSATRSRNTVETTWNNSPFFLAQSRFPWRTLHRFIHAMAAMVTCNCLAPSPTAVVWPRFARCLMRLSWKCPAEWRFQWENQTKRG